MIRDYVLRQPLGMEITKGDIFDEDQHVHFVAIHEERVVGCVVLIPNYQEGVGKLRQMATLEEVRGMGFGKMLVWQLEKYAKRHGMTQIVLHARHYAMEFYKMLHYKADPEVFQEVGIDHYRMIKSI